MSRPLLIAIEKGNPEVSPEVLVRLADIYGKPVGELLRPAPPPLAIGARLRYQWNVIGARMSRCVITLGAVTGTRG